jgi:hypothetical protein
VSVRLSAIDAFICGAAGGYTNLFLKGVAELVKNLFNGERSQLDNNAMHGIGSKKVACHVYGCSANSRAVA